MNLSFFAKNQSYLAIVLILLFLGSSFLVDPLETPLVFRGIRAAISFIIFLLIILSGSRNIWVKLHLLFYGLSSLASLKYEDTGYAIFSMILNGVSTLFLIKLLLGRLQFKKMGWIMISAFIIAIVINVWHSYSFIIILGESIDSPMLIASISFFSILIFIMAVLALIYNYESSTSTSIAFIFFTVFLIFAELLRGAGYYAVIDERLGQYLARVLLVLGSVLLYRFTYLERQKIHL